MGKPAVNRLALHVEGMMCQNNCGSTVRSALLAVPGTNEVAVSFKGKWALVEYDGEGGNRQPLQEYIDAVEDVGFSAEPITNQKADFSFSVDGMMCQKNCGTTVFNTVMAVAGVAWAEVSFADKIARVWGSVADPDEIIEEIENVGFGATFIAEAAPDIEAPAFARRETRPGGSLGRGGPAGVCETWLGPRLKIPGETGGS